jgi:hypothetical protein
MAKCMPFGTQDKAALRALDADFAISDETQL